MPSDNTEQKIRGNVLQQQNYPDGTSRVVIDNGPASTITIHCRAEQLHGLLGTDLHDVVAHLMTRAPGHFRRK
jgi:hypothetical protein